MDESLLTGGAQIAGVVTVVGFGIRWVYTIERDMIRRYAKQVVNLETKIVECEAEADKWKDAYYDLRESALRSVAPKLAVQRHIPPENTTPSHGIPQVET